MQFQISEIFFRFAGGGRHADNGHIHVFIYMYTYVCIYMYIYIYIWILLTVVFTEAGVAQSV